MSGNDRTSFEFETDVDEAGRITLPPDVAGALGKPSGRIHVRLTAKAVSSELQRRDVYEDEIERIGKLQLETRQQVVKFLLTEGALKKPSARRRKR